MWGRFFLRRLASLLVVLAALLFASFMLVRLIPGDPAIVVAGADATEQRLTEIRHGLGLDLPPFEQLGRYVGNVLHGDLGSSFITHEPVSILIARDTGTSLQLALASLAVVMVASVPFGVVAAALTRDGRHRRLELLFTALTSVTGSLPEFLSATLLALVFAVWLRLLPVAGTAGWQTLVLPTFAVAARPSAILARIVRVETLGVLAQDYIRTARSKRLPDRLIYGRHALPNVLTGTLAIGGIVFTSIIGGAVIVENVFGRVGLGTALVDAVISRDYPVVQGIVLVLGTAVVVINALVDVAAGILDPRSLSRQA